MRGDTVSVSAGTVAFLAELLATLAKAIAGAFRSSSDEEAREVARTAMLDGIAEVEGDERRAKFPDLREG
jgi:hypothetical protein